MGSDYLYETICQVTCGDERGSGFLVKRDIVLTSDHVIAPYYVEDAPVSVRFEGMDAPIECEVLTGKESKSKPLVLIKLPEERNVAIASLSNITLKEEDVVKAHGYFSNSIRAADATSFQFVRTYSFGGVENSKGNVLLKPISEPRTTFKGLSGAPIVHNGHIIGMLNEQVGSENKVDRVCGLYGTEFRQKLSELGITLDIVDVGDTPEIRSGNIVAAQSIKATYVTEIDFILSELFEPIRANREHGEIVTSQEQLKSFLERLESSNCSQKTKAEFYYIASVWMLLDHQENEAQTYYQYALREDPNIDTSVYRAYELIGHNQIEDAKQILVPINTPPKLNAYLTCFISEQKALTEVLSVIAALGVPLDVQSYRLLALIALQSDRFDEGMDYVSKANPSGHTNIELLIIKALLHYWSVMKDYFPNADRMSLVFASNHHFCPTPAQIEKLEVAYKIFEDLHNSKPQLAIGELEGTIDWALLVLSGLIPGKDYALWLLLYREKHRLNPLGILYSISKNAEIPNDICDEFLSIDNPPNSPDLYACAKQELLIYLKEFDKAKDHFNTHKALISQYRKLSQDECELQLLIDCECYAEARALMSKLKLTKELEERYEIGILDCEAAFVIKPLVERAINLAKKTRNLIDFRNAAMICRKHKKWKKAIGNAKLWWQSTSELLALECLAEAYYMKGHYCDCIKTCDRSEKEGWYSIKIKEYKMNSLVSLTRFEEARKLSDSFADIQTNARLVVFQARTYISEGKKDKAIQIMRAYADKGLYDLELYQILIELIQGDEPDLAYQYAKELYLNDPKNKNIIRFAGNVAIMTGHDDSELSSAYGMQMQEDVAAGAGMRAVGYEEIREILQEHKKATALHEELYRSAKCPIHIIANADNGVMAGRLWSAFNSANPFYARFGIEKECAIDYCKPILLDYSSCFVLHQLCLLGKICDLFKNVWVDQHLFEVWTNDSTRLKNVQTSVVQRAIQLSDMLNTLSYHEHPISLTVEGCKPYAIQDCILIDCAKQNHALLIDDSPHGTFSGDPIPEEWHAVRIGTDDFYAALDRLYLPHPDYNEKNVNPEASSKIAPQCSLVLENQVLNELCDANALGVVFACFNIHLAKEYVQLIHRNAAEYRNQAEAVQWIENGYNLLSTLHAEGKVKLIPDAATDNEEKNPYTKMLFNEMKIAMKKSVTFIVDDRFTSSYHRVSHGRIDSPILTTYDLICALYSDGQISTRDYYKIIDQLFEMGYCFFPPPPEYLFNRLQLVTVKPSGLINENALLKRIRRAIAIAFDADVGLSPTHTGCATLPEFSGYFIELNGSFRKCLELIWKSEESREWRCAASDWLLAFVGDFLCDTQKTKTDVIEMLSIKHFSLLSASRLLFHSNRNEEYMEWLVPYLLASWRTNPALIDAVSEQVVSFLNNVELRDENSNEYMRSVVDYVISQFILSFPSVLRVAVMEKMHLTEEDVYSYDQKVIQSLPDLYDAVVPISTLDEEGIIAAQETALEEAIMFVLQNSNKNSAVFFEAFPKEKFYAVSKDRNQELAQFLSDLSWYIPTTRMHHIHTLKRTLSLIST